jgi:hypothetical protein
MQCDSLALLRHARHFAERTARRTICTASAPRLCHICAEALPRLSKTCHICLRLATSAPGGTYHHLRWGCPAAVRGRARPHPRRDLLPGVASDRPSLFRGTPKRHDEAVRPWHHAVLDRLRTPLCSALLSPLNQVLQGGVGPSPGADVGAASPALMCTDVAAACPVPAQMWEQRAQSRCRCGRFHHFVART